MELLTISHYVDSVINTVLEVFKNSLSKFNYLLIEVAKTKKHNIVRLKCRMHYIAIQYKGNIWHAMNHQVCLNNWN